MSASIPRTASWRTLELGPGGRSLIEASAGTGKTWTIAALYLRLLLEGATPLTPRQIVVTTFTDAAAQELRERVRARLLSAEGLALTATRENAVAAPGDEFAQWLLQRWHDGAGNAGSDLLRLRLALAELDLAPIGTLHSLCRRILAEFPFESGSGFRAPALIDGEDLLDELVEDLWRCVQQSSDAAHAGKLAQLRETMRLALAPGVEVWAPTTADLARVLPLATLQALDTLLSKPALFKTSRSKLGTALRALAAFARDPSTELTAKHLEDLLDDDLSTQFKPQRVEEMRASPVLHQARSAARLLGYVRERERIVALQRWCTQLRLWRDERLAARDQQTFDSLIERVAAALAVPGNPLAAALHQAWPAALVDEFQDTDALQYAILDRIYGDGRAAGVPDHGPRGRLVLIGDPKQAIYGFRGGDVDTYLRAAKSANQALDLDVNWRSSSAYVAALNELYAKERAQLSSRGGDIAYNAVRAGGRRDAQPYCDANGNVHTQPLQLHYCAQIDDAAPQRRERALHACANHIASVLNADERIGDRRVEPRDIAVLLPTHRDVTRLRELLQLRDVPCVTGAPGSVFESDTARELHLVLFALAHPNEHGALRAALATSLGGWTFAKLSASEDDLTAELREYDTLRQQWRREGVLAVVLTLAREAAKRLSTLGERERLLTDLRHLGELLQAQAQQLEGEAQLLVWLGQQRRGEGEDVEAAQERRLRLESDAERVRLLTLHASKGLEFSIVFLPLMWTHGARPRQTLPLLREPLHDHARVLGFGPVAHDDAKWMDQDERHRVLYVALTRARYACHVYVLKPQRPAGAKRASTLADPERSALDALVERLLAAHDARPHVAWIDSDWAWPDTRYTPPRDEAPCAPHARNEPQRAPAHQAYSFSALIAQQGAASQDDDAAADEARPLASVPAEEEGESDVAAVQPAPPHPALLALAPLRGTEFGNAVHAVFERRVIGEPLVNQRGLIERCLREFAVRSDALPRDAAVDAVAERVEATLAAELLPGLRLRDVPLTRQRAEMAFHFVLDDVSIGALRATCARHGAAEVLPPQLGNSTLRGLMSGKIDLVFEHRGRFHVLDYKSNWLGERLADYTGSALDVAMDAHAYRLQALLYSVAVQRYLRQRVPQYRAATHMGEAIYLFVRATQLAPQAGVWQQQFDPALLDAVDHVLGGAPP